jgi:hypothetical protein
LVLGLCLCASASAAGADAPLLHEFIEADAAEDLELRATTPDGQMPAAVRTPSGLISAPGFGDVNGPRQVAYGGQSTPDSIDSVFRLDRDTTEPSVVRYDDPFTPSLSPFKRLYAFDSVDAGLELTVRDKQLVPVPVGGELLAGEEHFFGDLFVDLAPAVPVRIPSVGPGTRALAVRVEPALKLEIQRDGAENWFALSSERKRVRLILELAVPRASFGSEFAEVSYAELTNSAPRLPASAVGVVNEVLAHLGLSQAVPPRVALDTLVAHFRGFSPSAELPQADSGAALYRELVLERRGVCRHRAYGFVLTALGLGLPARFVRNEAHAWVEVFDGKLWHRIDLGGAARRFDVDSRASAPNHVPPPDPYPWPEGSDAALSASRSSTGSGTSDPNRSASQPLPSAAASGPSAGPVASARPPVAPPRSGSGSEVERPRSAVELDVDVAEARRGAALRVTGAVSSAGATCPNARVDIVLIEPAGEALIGSVPTDGQGRFDSRVTIPFDIDVGEHTLRASTPGAGECGPSE